MDVSFVRDDRWFPRRCLRAFFEQQGLDRAMVVASQSFTALIPLMILTSAVLPRGGDSSMADAVIRKFGLSGATAESVRTVFEASSSGSVGVLSLLLLVLSGVSLTRRLQKMYLDAWHVPPLPGVRGSLYAALGLGFLLTEIALLSFVRTVLRALPFEGVLSVAVSLAASIALWTTIPWLLLHRRLAWRRLLLAGILTGVLTSLWGLATTVYMPRLMASYSERYGLFGITVALVGWLLCISFIVVVSTIVVAELDRAPERWAVRLRSVTMSRGG
ncbi:MAG TPA: YhjD/YihY/BrkB family envelope integrity protein [Ornithinibacter sp.]|nr:YhjD/YihY/BrkB family envelope integrity protein [Ornithinibacter sp.]